MNFLKMQNFVGGGFKQLGVKKARTLIKRGSTFVCGEHFHEDDFQQSLTGGIVKRLEIGAVPSRFQWNDYASQLKRVCVFDRVKHRTEQDIDLSTSSHPTSTLAGFHDHGYESCPPPGMY